MNRSIEEKLARYAAFGSVLGLDRMKRLMKMLGDPQDDLKCIHVAGTNGKGSVSTYIYRVLREAGCSVGIFTSPFVTVFNERITADDAMISDADILHLLDEINDKVDEMLLDGYESPTEFEILTAMAFLYFQRKKVDFAVFEVGLGGTGDSTNIIQNPLVSVITSISYDHTERLGETIEEIAYEKAGIIKPGAPLVISVKIPEAARVIAKRAYELGAPLYDTAGIVPIISKDGEDGENGEKFSVTLQGVNYGIMTPGMRGKHQITNVVTALTAIEILRKKRMISISSKQVRRAISAANLPGRFEQLCENPSVIADGAHNVESIRALTDNMKMLHGDKKILCMLAILKDKQYESMCEILAELRCDFIVTEIEGERGLPGAELGKTLLEKKQKVIFCGDIETAYGCAMDEMRRKNYDVLLFAGSLYLVGDVRRMFFNEHK